MAVVKPRAVAPLLPSCKYPFVHSSFRDSFTFFPARLWRICLVLFASRVPAASWRCLLPSGFSEKWFLSILRVTRVEFPFRAPITAEIFIDANVSGLTPHRHLRQADNALIFSFAQGMAQSMRGDSMRNHGFRFKVSFGNL